MPLQQTYDPILDEYHEHGYMDARIDTNPVLDAAARTVSYSITVTPGVPYTEGAVHADGLSGKAQSEYEQAWLLKPGTVYDASYPKTFLRKNSVMRSLEPYTAIYETKADPATHKVDLTIHFLNNNTGR